MDNNLYIIQYLVSAIFLAIFLSFTMIADYKVFKRIKVMEVVASIAIIFIPILNLVCAIGVILSMLLDGFYYISRKW